MKYEIGSLSLLVTPSCHADLSRHSPEKRGTKADGKGFQPSQFRAVRNKVGQREGFRNHLNYRG